MRVHHLSCATMCPFGKSLIEGTGSLFETGTMCCHVLLLEGPDGLVLVDAGFGLDDVRTPARLGRAFLALTRPTMREEETAIRQIERLGFSAADVRHVVLTHLDLDHAGGISDFPRARIHLYARELEAGLHPTFAEKGRYRQVQWAHGPDWAPHETSGDSWYGFDSVRAMPGTLDDVLIVPLTGHTRGHSAIAVKSERGWMLHAGDAYFHRGEIDWRHPRCPPGLAFFQSVVQIDGKTRKDNQRRLRELAREHGDEIQIFSAHDPVELARMRAASA